MRRHDHDHSHAPKDFGKAFAIGTALNLAYVVVQVCFGIFAHSVALLASRLMPSSSGALGACCAIPSK